MRSERRSKQVELNLFRLSERGYLVPGRERSQLEEEYRIIKRPLLKNATGEGAAPVERANLIMVTSALPGEGKTYSSINLAISLASGAGSHRSAGGCRRGSPRRT